MIADLKPYQAYRESGLPWFGEVPEHWKQRRCKFLFRERAQKGYPDEPLLAATQSKGVVRKDEYGSRTVTATKDLHLLKLVEQGDYVISLRSFEGGIEVAHSRGIISPAYTVLAPQKEASHGYFTHFFKSPDFIRSLTLFVTGIREGQNIDYERLSRAYLPLPPPDEQAAIVRFLNWSNGQLEKAIRAKHRQLALVREMITNETDNALMSQNTTMQRLSIVVQVMMRPIDRRSGQIYTRIGLYNRGRGIFHKDPVLGSDLGDSDFFTVLDGDFVFSGQFAWEGAVALVRTRDSGCIASHRYPILRGREGVVLSSFLFAFFRSSYGSMLLDVHSRGAAGRNRPLNVARLLKEDVPIPAISTQKRIAELLDREYVIARSVESMIAAVNEYRTRLVADVVTGKLDVREAAAKLPDEVLIELPDNDNVDVLEDEPFEEEALV